MLHFQQVPAERDCNGFGAVGGAELFVDDVQVLLDALLADAELNRDLAVGESARDGGEDLQLAVREGRRVRNVGETLADLVRKEGLAVRYGFEGRQELGVCGALQEGSRGTCGERGRTFLGIGEGRQDKDACLRGG